MQLTINSVQAVLTSKGNDMRLKEFFEAGGPQV